MSKLLYVSDGKFISFLPIDASKPRTHIIENSKLYNLRCEKDINKLLEEVITAEEGSLIKTVNNLPRILLLSEFEIINE